MKNVFIGICLVCLWILLAGSAYSGELCLYGPNEGGKASLEAELKRLQPADERERVSLEAEFKKIAPPRLSEVIEHTSYPKAQQALRYKSSRENYKIEHSQVIENSSDQEVREVLVEVKFKSPLEDSEIEHHYALTLKANGWSYVGCQNLRDWGRDLGVREFSYKKANHKLFLFVPGRAMRKSYGCAYSLDLVWDASDD